MINRNILAAALAVFACWPATVAAQPDVEASDSPFPVGAPAGDEGESAGVVTTDTHRLQEVADGVYFAEYTLLRFNSNSLVVVNEEDVLVVDSHITPATGRALIASIRQITDKPITTLVNTHFHYDHAHGNQAFGAVTIVGHEFTRRMMAGEPLKAGTYQDWLGRTTHGVEIAENRLETMEEGEERANVERYLAGVRTELAEAKEIAPVAPNVTLQERLTLFRGSREIQVVFCGRAHTGGDVVVFLPKERLVFTGDMMVGGPSWLGDGHVDEWPDSLEKLKTLDFDLIVPGHGPPFRNRDLIDHVAAYYRDLWREVAAARAAGKSIGQAAGSVDLTGHKDTLGIQRPGVDPQAVGRIYALLEARGE